VSAFDRRRLDLTPPATTAHRDAATSRDGIERRGERRGDARRKHCAATVRFPLTRRVYALSRVLDDIATAALRGARHVTFADATS
jgi:hypothetical protein